MVGYLLYEPQGVFNSKYENVVSLISLSLSLYFLHYPLSFSILVGVIQKPYQRLKGHYDLSSWFIMFHIIPSTLILSCIHLHYPSFPHLPPPPLPVPVPISSPLTRLPQTHKSSSSCYHHLLGTPNPGLLSASRKRSRIGPVKIY